MRAKPLTEKQKEKIIKLRLEENLTAKVIAERFNVSKATVYAVIDTYKKEHNHVCNTDQRGI